ncbi:hypothetical protein GWI33_019100 [Rhynchophorus ferrugineus]|uniref:Uncharacterized protein n=1 Tax=Rhynchophorus ferrugineus TaxID=354439 RepID=A0A834HWN9_RHYFE|nr:hypothetical protein GWI33_019100 [Rhynchophorus ferrugineus]
MTPAADARAWRRDVVHGRGRNIIAMCRSWRIVFVLFFVILGNYCVTAQDLSCCAHTTGTCKSVCGNVSTHMGRIKFHSSLEK